MNVVYDLWLHSNNSTFEFETSKFEPWFELKASSGKTISLYHSKQQATSVDYPRSDVVYRYVVSVVFVCM